MVGQNEWLALPSYVILGMASTLPVHYVPAPMWIALTQYRENVIYTIGIKLTDDSKIWLANVHQIITRITDNNFGVIHWWIMNDQLKNNQNCLAVVDGWWSNLIHTQVKSQFRSPTENETSFIVNN